MKIDYRLKSEFLPVDLERLRPKGSYADLFAKRTHSIDQLIEKHGKIPPEFLKTRRCPTCASDAQIPEMHKDHLDIVRCKECDVVYVSPIFDEEHYKETYRSEDYQAIVRQLGEESHLYRVDRFGKERVSIMSRFLPKDAQVKFLDIGCSTGFVVEAAKNHGWDAQGIDLNPSAIAFGQKRGLSLQNIPLEDLKLPAGTFDAIGMFDVLEHVTNPGEIVELARRLLKPGGILFLYVPNYDSASRSMMGKDAHFIWPTHHLNYYTPATLTDFLARHNLKPEYVATEGLDIIDYIWQRKELHGVDTTELERIADDLQFFINAGSYGKNLRMVLRKQS